MFPATLVRQKRATEEQRQTVDKLFNEQIGLKLEIPRQQV
jgi:hypothetical protein